MYGVYSPRREALYSNSCTYVVFNRATYSWVSVTVLSAISPKTLGPIFSLTALSKSSKFFAWASERSNEMVS